MAGENVRVNRRKRQPVTREPVDVHVKYNSPAAICIDSPF